MRANTPQPRACTLTGTAGHGRVRDSVEETVNMSGTRMVPPQAGPGYQGRRPERSGQVGWVGFAGVVMILMGAWQAVEGLVAVGKPSHYLVGKNRLVVSRLHRRGLGRPGRRRRGGAGRRRLADLAEAGAGRRDLPAWCSRGPQHRVPGRLPVLGTHDHHIGGSDHRRCRVDGRELKPCDRKERNHAVSTAGRVLDHAVFLLVDPVDLLGVQDLLRYLPQPRPEWLG